MPPQARVAAAILLPLSGLTAIYATDLYASYAGWAIVAPALLPPLIALYAMWMRLPALHAALPAKVINAAAWGAMLVLTFAPFPLSVIDARIYAAGEPERQRQREAYLAAQNRIQAQFTEQTRERDIARFQALNADSPLRDYFLDLADPEDSTHHEEALAKARQVKSRQSDVVALLEEPVPAIRARGVEGTSSGWRICGGSTSRRRRPCAKRTGMRCAKKRKMSESIATIRETITRGKSKTPSSVSCPT